MKTNPEMLLKILINGGIVISDGFEHMLEYPQNKTLCARKIGTDHWYPIDLSIESFLNWSHNLDRDELWIQCCAMELKNESR